MTFRQPKSATIITDHKGLREGLLKSLDSCSIVMIGDTEFVCTERNLVRNEFHLRELIRVSTVPLCAGVEVAPWTGPEDGLPPVGTVCEMQDGVGAWTKVEIFADHKYYVHGWDENKRISYFSNDPSEFRPIRTPEQIAAEEREKAVGHMWSVWNANFEGHVKDGLYALYDSGYIKKVQS